MFSRILVPLDGSPMAESVLPATVQIARQCGGRIILLHIIERNAPPKIHGKLHLTNARVAETYLQELTARAFPEDVPVERDVHETAEEHVPSSIVDHVSELEINLIIMCPHGRRRLTQMLFGNVAQQVIALGKTPVLMPHEGAMMTAQPDSGQRVLVPLDGDPEHEQSLPVAPEMAQACAASLHFLVIVPTLRSLSGPVITGSRLAPRATAEVLEMEEEAATEYVRVLQDRFKETKCPLSAEVARGEPVKVILETGRRLKVDMIVMGTHGRIGAEGFWEGSVSPRVFHRAKVHLMLVPVMMEGKRS